MTEKQCIEGIERMAMGAKRNAADYAGMDGALVASALGDAILLIIGAFRNNAESLGAILAIQDVMKGDTTNAEKIMDALNRTSSGA